MYEVHFFKQILFFNSIKKYFIETKKIETAFDLILKIEFCFVLPTVSDTTSNSNSEQHRFSIRVLPVNNMPPRFESSAYQIDVSQGGNAPLRRSLLSLSDADTPLTDIMLTLYKAPAFGRIEKVFDGGRVYIRQGW